MKRALSSLCLLFAVSCKPPEGCPVIDCALPACATTLACQPEDCSNTTDDNGDNAIDCDDPQCTGSALCPTCGDGVSNPGEQCDDGNQTPADGCEDDCTLTPGPDCGDGVLNPGEQCDDGNNNNGDGCLSNCILPAASCGDSIVNVGEQCDDGNQTPADGCENDCTNTITCGNGVLNPGEECDDANILDGDGCDSTCQNEAVSFCGDGVLDAGEQCDDGALNSDTEPDTCRLNCALPFCGDAVLDSDEECDDGNNANSDGCQSDCSIPPPPFDVSCPEFTDLNKLCVPLPNTGNQLTELGPNGVCGAGFFKENPANSNDNAESFSIRKLFDDVILIKETNNFTGERPVMVLFLGADSALLYDSGHVTGAVLDVITPFLEGRPVELLNTHLHGDHINNNPDLAVIAIETTEVNTHCGINANSFDANNAADCNNITAYNPPNAQELFNNQNFVVVRVVRDGHQIDLGGHQITVLFTPGHSRTSVTLHDTTRQILFTGDTLYPDTDTISGGDVGIPLVHPSGSNLSEYFATAQRYAALEGQVLAVVGAHSQGTMPARSLSAFLQVVQNRVNGGGNNAQFNDPQGCSAGNFSVQGFPP